MWAWNFGGDRFAPAVGANAIALMLLRVTNIQPTSTALPVLLAYWTLRTTLGGSLGIYVLRNVLPRG